MQAKFSIPKELKGKRINKHDAYFKHIFKHPWMVVEFLRAYLPKELLHQLDLTTLKLEDTSFLPSRFKKKYRADVLYSVKTRRGQEVLLLIHIEHQGRIDIMMDIRVFEYQVAVMRAWKHYNLDKKVPTILSFVVYHGKAEWKGSRSLADMFADFSVYQMSLTHPFLIDLTRASTQELEKHGKLSATEIILKQQSTQRMADILEKVLPLLNKQESCCKEEAIDYMMSVDKGDPEVFFDKLCKYDPSTGDNYRTMFQTHVRKAEKRSLMLGRKEGVQQGLQQGRQEGIQQGLQQGMQRGVNEVLEKLAKAGFNRSKLEEILK